MHDREDEIVARLHRLRTERLTVAAATPVGALTLTAWSVPAAADGHVGEPVPFADAVDQDYTPVAVGDPWGPAWATTWFRVRGSVPADARHPEVVLDLGWSGAHPGFQAEALVFTPDGATVKALNPDNTWLPVVPGQAIDWFVEAAANPTVLDGFGPTDLGDRRTAGDEPLYVLTRADIVEVVPEVVELGHDLDVLDGLRATLPPGSGLRSEIVVALDRSLDRLDPHDLAGTAAAARAELAGLLARPAAASAHAISAVGHAHIDSAWLWPLRETVRKVARTTANVVQLLDSGSELVYAMSSAQQWAWIEQHHPDLFARIKAHVDAGRFVPVGGMWVESDTNMVGGEAMVRQFLHGQSWFRDHLGVTCSEVWLPDSFGYTGALPQIVVQSGLRWFLTQKISWNTVNHFPHHTFWWEGIDGTRVFTHFPPADTYNATVSGAELAHAAENFRDKGATRFSLLPFGHGDGGGGPTREMLARARRVADLDGSPTVRVERPADFFARAEADYPDAPVWVGELYLEIHRGTYTSQARTKAGNRRNEALLAQVEQHAVAAAVRDGAPYPYNELDAAWQTLLLHQFHDILPGSSIHWVHREAEAAHAELTERLEAVLPAPAPSPTGRSARSPRLLDNDRLRVEFDDTGVITSLRDLAADREVLPPGGRAGLLQLHPDTPNRWDAWDIDRFYRHVGTDLVLVDAITVEADTVTVTRSFGASRVVQRFTLRPDSAALDVETEVDWHERERVLKLAFDLDVHTDQARYETQFGYVVRPTHENTSWDAARFEVCAHRWVQVAEAGGAGYGIALANATTYGHDVTRRPRSGGGTYSRVRASLLRAPRFPDPISDQGRHVFRHRLVPGADVLNATRAGIELNQRPRGGEPLVTVDGPVLVETVKLAHDRSGDVIVRLYEPCGVRAEATVTPTFPVRATVETDLLEQPAHTGSWADGRIRLRPFQILTLRMIPEA